MYYDGCIHIEEEDQCFSCEYYLKGVSCPLLEALALGVVELQNEIIVRNCGFYQKFERKLRLIELEEPPAKEPAKKSKSKAKGSKAGKKQKKTSK